MELLSSAELKNSCYLLFSDVKNLQWYYLISFGFYPGKLEDDSSQAFEMPITLTSVHDPVSFTILSQCQHLCKCLWLFKNRFIWSNISKCNKIIRTPYFIPDLPWLNLFIEFISHVKANTEVSGKLWFIQSTKVQFQREPSLNRIFA